MSVSSHPEEKSDIHVRVLKVTEKRLRAHIQQKYGEFKKGLISKEVELAIKNHLRFQCAQQQCTKNMQSQKNEIYTVKKFMQKITKYIFDTREGYQLERGKTLPLKFLDEAISNLRGSDPRTIKRWTDLLIQNEYLHKISIGAYEVIDSGFDFDDASQMEVEVPNQQ